MTELRDDGYLSTDNPVVAACFLGKHIHIGGAMPLESELLAVWRTMAVVIDTTGMVDTDMWDYPILIPASVVAEVCRDDEGKATFEWVVLMEAMDADGLYIIDDWIKKHGGTDHE